MGRQITIAIVGVGLIGGSLGLAWRKAGVARIIGIDRDQDGLDRARRYGAIDQGTTDIARGVAEADIVVLCTPVAEIVTMAKRVAAHARPGTLLTDVGSAKALIMKEVARFLPAEFCFIGGHPMAGSERTGVEAADPYLFAGAIYCLTPPEALGSNHVSMQCLENLVRALGATPLILTPEAHDLVVAGISHMPHLVASALVNSAAAKDSVDLPLLRLAASGFRDTTRIAAGDPGLWRDICLSNATAIVEMLDAFIGQLHSLRQIVARGEDGALREFLQAAKDTRVAMPAVGAAHELAVTLIDEPGAICAVTALLAAEGLNIVDLGILRVRAGEGGTLRVALRSAEAADRAQAILQKAGYVVRLR